MRQGKAEEEVAALDSLLGKATTKQDLVVFRGLKPEALAAVPNSMREGELTLTVEKVTAQTIRMRLEGSMLLSGTGPLKLYPTGVDEAGDLYVEMP